MKNPFRSFALTRLHFLKETAPEPELKPETGDILKREQHVNFGFLKGRGGRWHGGERRMLFELPVILESLILLVESGLGLLPALQRVVSDETSTQNCQHSPVRNLFRLVHQLSARGMPLSDALENVSARCPHRTLRHVFLHLDISGNEGGALIPSLQSLAQHAHTEWRLTVETRVRRLENFVVFPVFGAVIGLVLLTVAVPLVPLIDLGQRLDQQAAEASQPEIYDSRN